MRLQSLVVFLTAQIAIPVPAQNPILSFSGSSLAAIGDIDGDGAGDLIVGTPTAPGGGIAEIRSGATGNVIRTLSAIASQDRFGTSVAGVGDVDGDLVPDVAVGAPQPLPTGVGSPTGCPQYFTYDPGYVRVFSGATGLVIHHWVGPTVPYWAAGQYGISIAGIGDVDGDGAGDVIVAQPGGPLNSGNCCIATSPYPGRAEIRSGASGAVIRTHASGYSEIWPTIVSELGDVDQDGTRDYAIGSRGQVGTPACWSTAVPSYPARLDVRSGATGAPLMTQTSPTGGGPVHVAPAGDVNGDGAADIVTRQENNGSVQSIVWSGASASMLFSVTETGLGTSTACATAGDRDGDGLDEVILGDRIVDRVRFLSPLSNSTTTWTLGTGAPGFLEALGDLDGDGTTEFAALIAGTWEVFSGAVATSVQAGGGCGPGAIAPALTSTSPALGETLLITYGFGSPGAVGSLVAGAPAPNPIPQVGGCLAYVDLAAPFTIVAPVVLDAAGTWSTPIVVPDGPVWAGFSRRVQGWAAPAFGGLSPFEVTNALDITVGH